MKIFFTYTVVVILLLAGISLALGGALHDGCREEDVTVKALLEAGADVERQGSHGGLAYSRNGGAPCRRQGAPGCRRGCRRQG